MELMKHQKEAMEAVEGRSRVAYYHDMGLGKTFTGAETMYQFGGKTNLVICQKSKLRDWLEHFIHIYPADYFCYDLTNRHDFEPFLHPQSGIAKLGVINYDLVFRRPELLDMHFDTVLLDESSLIQNEKAKRAKFIMKLDFDNLILLSGTPTSGKYENLWSQMRLLGWGISKSAYWSQFIKTKTILNQGFPIKVVTGYKNVDRLKRKMREHGCHFLKTEDVLELPSQNDIQVACDTNRNYRQFVKDRIVQVDDQELVGDTPLTAMLYARQLCGQYSRAKLNAFKDLLASTDDRLIVFYNFYDEAGKLIRLANEQGRPWCIINGREKNLAAYENFENSITFIQYQAGAMGLNLQLANKIVYFTPPLSSELFEQSKKRIHRIGQDKPCFYYYLTCKGSIEEKIYETLAMRKDFTDALFKEVIR